MSQTDTGFFALELSRDFDWIRPRLSLAYASGDDDPFDDKSNGYDARNLSGGMHAWQRAGLSVVDRKGRPGRVA